MKTRILKLASVLLSLCMLLSVGTFAADTAEADSLEDYLRSPINTDLSNAMKPGLAFEDGNFTILQLSDLADGSMPYPTMLKYIREVVRFVDPDLVVLTGDITSKSASAFGMTGTAIDWVVSALQGYPFTIAFGDEDAFLAPSKLSYLSKYMKYNNCLAYHDEPTHSGVGDHNLFIFNDAAAAEAQDLSQVGFNLWFLDSNRSGFKFDQGLWYAGKENHAIANEAGYTIPSMMFSHLPLPQMSLLMNGKELGGTIPAYAEGKDGSDVLGQSPTVNGEVDMKYNDSIDMFQYMNDWGNVIAMVSGHDYKNQFVRSWTYDYKGEERTLDFIQTGGMGFTRKCEATRGARVIELKLETPGVAPEEGAVGVGEAPVVSIDNTYTIDYFQFFDFVNEEGFAEKVYYYAGANWFFGWNASMIANFLGIFGVDKFYIVDSVTQFFGETFNFLFNMK